MDLDNEAETPQALTAGLARSLSYRKGSPVPVEDVELIAHCPVLWSGWECDHDAYLYRLRSTGQCGIHVESEVSDPSCEGPAAMLEERLAAYRKAIAATETMLARIALHMPEAARPPRGTAGR